MSADFGFLKRDIQRYWPPLIGIFLIILLAYSYIATTILFTNHTVPNSSVYPYPSFKTLQEGRWAADLFIQMAGGSGVQATQFILAIGLKAVNALLLCKILRIEKPSYLFLLGTVLALHPTFLDYYAFTVDDTTFEFGDGLSLLAVLALARINSRPKRIIGASLLFVLSTAMYQPKLALSATLVLLWVATDDGQGDDLSGQRRPITKLVDGVCALAVAVVLYYISLKFTLTPTEGARGHLNSIYSMLHQIGRSYDVILGDFTRRVDYLPKKLSLLPVLIVILGVVIILNGARKKGATCFFVSLAALIAIPPALQLSFVINDETFTDVGRILSPHAYFLVFLLGMIVTSSKTKKIGIAGGIILIYFFFVVANQEASAAALKSIFDSAKMNRITARIESVVPDLYSKKFSLVIIGELGVNQNQNIRRFPNELYRSQYRTETFISWQHAVILNFYLGRGSVIYPTHAEVDAAVEAAKTKQPWPSAESVFLQGDVIVVLLKPVEPGILTTWARD